MHKYLITLIISKSKTDIPQNCQGNFYSKQSTLSLAVINRSVLNASNTSTIRIRSGVHCYECNTRNMHSFERRSGERKTENKRENPTCVRFSQYHMYSTKCHLENKIRLNLIYRSAAK